MSEKDFPLIFERGKPGRTSYSLPDLDVEETDLDQEFDEAFIRTNPPELPEVSELEIIRHYTWLSQRNYSIDTGFYALGSCTMKYNPKINEDVANLPGFTHVHPHQDPSTVQGAMEMMQDLQASLAEITGMYEASLQTAAGAQGELTSLMMISKFHKDNGESNRTKVIIPDSAHGTNPASAAVAGLEAVTVKSNEEGLVDLEDLRNIADEDTAALMLTNPNTLGLFEKNIREMADIIHGVGGKVYYDGANLQAIMGYAHPGDMGCDAVHLNLHKTFTGPHGGGGPGSGPVLVSKELEPYLPMPVIKKSGDAYIFDYDRPLSIGRVKPYYGNFGINLRAYTYIRTMGAEGLQKVSEHAVINANYLMRQLEDTYDVPFKQHCMHEFILSGKNQKKQGVRTLDIAKRLLDFNHHPPTIYFPLVVDEAMLAEPTETESKETLDDFIAAMKQIAKESEEEPETVQEAPHDTIVSRMDETTAARKPVLRYTK